jgi:hypothetical protein
MTRDLRKYARNTNIRLLVGFILLLFIVGDGLIYLIYGPQGAFFGFICLIAGLAPLVLIALLLWILEWIVKRANED